MPSFAPNPCRSAQISKTSPTVSSKRISCLASEYPRGRLADPPPRWGNLGRPGVSLRAPPDPSLRAGRPVVLVVPVPNRQSIGPFLFRVPDAGVEELFDQDAVVALDLAGRARRSGGSGRPTWTLWHERFPSRLRRARSGEYDSAPPVVCVLPGSTGYCGASRQTPRISSSATTLGASRIALWAVGMSWTLQPGSAWSRARSPAKGVPSSHPEQ